MSRISELSKTKKILVSVSGLGEPTLYPELMDFLREIRSSSNAVIRLNTNASFLHLVGSNIISSNLVDRLTVSLNLPTEELYEKHTGSTDFSTACKNIEDFLKAKGTQSPSTEIYLIKTPETAPHLEESISHWNKRLNLNDSVSIAELSNWNGLVGEPQVPRITPCRFQTSLAGKRLTIDKDGYAGVCCFSIAFNQKHPLIVGNIRDHSIEELLKFAERRVYSLIGSRVCEGCNNDVVLTSLIG